jgi:hypothetical protein
MKKRTKCTISHPFLASVPFPKAQSARYHQYRVQVLEAWTSVAGFPVHMETVPIVKNMSRGLLKQTLFEHWSYYSVVQLSFNFSQQYQARSFYSPRPKLYVTLAHRLRISNIVNFEWERKIMNYFTKFPFSNRTGKINYKGCKTREW